MKTTVRATKNYLVLPIGSGAKEKEIVLTCGGETERVSVRLDYFAPEYRAYYPIGKFRGKEIDVETPSGAEVRDIQADEKDLEAATAYPFRPSFHFAPLFGWNNDPNGMFARALPDGKKEYHLFFQYNPYDVTWNNMHWGHAVSEDLVRWKELPVALAPEPDGTMFSGSAIVDEDNRSGLGDGKNPPILLFYTLAGEPFTQCLAFSTDGGKTFRKYEKNPIIGNVSPQNRDPKVEWCPELGRFVLALYTARQNDPEYTLFVSDDLLRWEKLQSLRIDGDSEFPDLYPLRAEGEPNKTYWIFSGCRHRYLVTECDGKGFRAVQGVRPLAYGTAAQAPQTFWGMPDGRRVGMTWLRDLPFPEPRPISAEMSFPYELKLLRRGADLLLSALPAREIEIIREKGRSESIELCGGEERVFPLDGAAFDLFFEPDEGRTEDFAVTVFGVRFSVDARANSVECEGRRMPLSLTGGKKTLRVLVDSCSLEFFSDEGTSFMPVGVRCDRNLPFIKIESRNGAVLKKFDLFPLKCGNGGRK